MSGDEIPAVEHLVEDWTRYEQSLPWRLHDAYYQRRGAAAWREREIPFGSTTNPPQVERMARVFALSVADRGRAEGDRPLWVLEVGAGPGHFAARFVAALDQIDARLGARLRLVASDYSRQNLVEMTASSHLSPLVEAGRVVPLRLDIGAPEVLEDLAGARFALPAGVGFDFVIASYVCSAIAIAPLAKRGSEWAELWVRTTSKTPLGDLAAEATRANAQAELIRAQEWRLVPGGPSEALGDFHGAIAEAAAAGHASATVFYPRRWFDFLRAVGPLEDGAPIVTCDYGTVRSPTYAGEHLPTPQVYGNSYAHTVAFALFDTFAAAAGYNLARTHDDLDNVHAAVLVRGAVGPRLRAGLDAGRVYGGHANDHLSDFAYAARSAAERNDYMAAMRFLRSCIALDPTNPTHRAQLADCALADGRAALAKEHVLAGLALEPTSHDWEFKLGRAEFQLGRTAEAIAAYEKSLAREPHPQTWLNLGAIHRIEGRLEEAYRCMRGAAALDNYSTRTASAVSEIEALMNPRGRSIL